LDGGNLYVRKTVPPRDVNSVNVLDQGRVDGQGDGKCDQGDAQSQ
jgi:hypothetical protein